MSLPSISIPARAGRLKVLASIEDPELIAGILSHLQQRTDEGNDKHHRTPFTARAPASAISVVVARTYIFRGLHRHIEGLTVTAGGRSVAEDDVVTVE